MVFRKLISSLFPPLRSRKAPSRALTAPVRSPEPVPAPEEEDDYRRAAYD